jgi:hypothetical protein
MNLGRPISSADDLLSQNIRRTYRRGILVYFLVRTEELVSGPLEDYFTENKAARPWFISSYSPFVKPVSISCIAQIKFSLLKYLLERTFGCSWHLQKVHRPVLVDILVL